VYIPLNSPSYYPSHLPRQQVDHIVIKLMIIDGMPTPSPTAIAILSDRLNPLLGPSALVSDGAVDCRVRVPVLVVVALVLEVLGCETVVGRNAQVNDEVQ
jgi:hypothetical protein